MARRDPLSAGMDILLDQAALTIVQLGHGPEPGETMATFGVDVQEEIKRLTDNREACFHRRTNADRAQSEIVVAREELKDLHARALLWRAAAQVALRMAGPADPTGVALVRAALGDRPPSPARAFDVVRDALDSLTARPKLVELPSLFTTVLDEGQALVIALRDANATLSATQEAAVVASAARHDATEALRENLRFLRQAWALAVLRNPRIVPMDLSYALEVSAPRPAQSPGAPPEASPDAPPTADLPDAPPTADLPDAAPPAPEACAPPAPAAPRVRAVLELTLEDDPSDD
jgi:hypothetical protein